MLILLTGTASPADERVQFNRDIRPLLSDTCFLCHGPDESSREASLRLDIREMALQAADSGAVPIVPGKPDESEIIRRIFAEDEGERMPPAEAHKVLTPQQKELFRRWVAEGAEYQPHWLYTPLSRPEPPAISDTSRVANAIDAFIQEPLVRRSITPSPEADRRTLLRRLSLDLTGLPPSREEIAEFLADTSPDAYEKQVDRLLQSEHFGERMAVWWLDVARFADTVGYHGDQNQRIFPYRDYVIDAFNRNKPFDQFTIEQLAGDLLPEPTVEQRIATGFNRLNMMTREGGAQPNEYLAKYAADRVRTVGTAWLGSTIGCAECHDHKFDPFTAKDFYSLGAFFADVKQWGVYSSYGYTPNPELKYWNNEYPFPPELQVESPFLKRELQEHRSEIRNLLAGAAKRLAIDAEQSSRFEQWQADLQAFATNHPDGWHVPDVTATVFNGGKPSEKTKLAVTDDHVVRLTRKSEKGDELRLTLDPAVRQIATIRLELVPDAAGDGAIVPALPRQIVQLKAAVQLANGKTRNVGFYFADADLKEPRYASTVEQIGVTNGWLTSEAHANQTHTSTWLLNPPVSLQEGEQLLLTVTAGSLVPVRAAVSPYVVDEVAPENAKALFFAATNSNPDVFTRYVELHRQVKECRDGKAWTMVTVAAEPIPMRVLPRGNWLDESGPLVDPAVPHFLPGSDTNADQRLTRLDLAKWLCSEENPVTSRAVMNRLWKPFFGYAFSNVVDDLGAQGEPPSHPELLDWLAVEFRESGWNMKHMVKTIVMSHSYRQSSTQRPELRNLDPDNRWLASQNPRRLDAEFVRDNALDIAGLLNPAIGGPSVKPYQPAGYYANLQFPNRNYVEDLDSRQWRRGLYMHWQRAFLHPMLANFDAPSREECTANRVVSNTPQQALTLLNDPSFVEAARVFADRLLSTAADGDEARLAIAFELAVSRPPTSAERDSLLRFLESQRTHFRANPEDASKMMTGGLAERSGHEPVEVAAWAQVARVILNLHETITRF